MLEARDITYSYSRNKALDRVSFQIPEKGVIALLGNNGSGKTTLIKILTGNLYPDEGEVLWKRNSLPEELFSTLEFGYLPEDFNPPRHYSLQRYFHYLSSILQVPIKTLPGLYDFFQLEPVKNKPIKKLSKGYRQRIGIMQAFLGEKKIVLLDEPTNGLDPSQRERFFHFLDNVRHDCLVIISSHSLEESLQSADYFLVIHEGRISFSGLKDELNCQVREYVVDVSGDITGIQHLDCEIISQKKISGNYCSLRVRSPLSISEVVNQIESKNLTVEKIDSGLTSLQSKLKGKNEEDTHPGS